MKKGGFIRKPILLSMMAFAFAPSLLASDPFLTLDTVVQTNGQLQFNLNGEDSVTYTIEGSGDLQNWTPVLINSGPATRTIVVDGSQNYGFYRASRAPLPLFAGAITAKSSVNLKGNVIVTDSYDSSDTNDFPGGLYNSAHRMDHGDVAVASNLIAIGNADIMGKVWIENGTIADVESGIGPDGAVGDVPFVTGGGTGLESTDFAVLDFRFYLPDVSAPFTSGGAISPPTAGKTNTLPAGIYFYNGNFSIPNTAALQVGAFQYVILYVTGNFTMTSTAQINIGPGGTLVLYVGGPSSSLTTVNNEGAAANFQYYGLPGNTSVSFPGNGIYFGTFYAPEANITISGGGTTTLDFMGAFVANSLNVNGHVNFHYDENLARSGPQR